ncbi:MAG: hypothetical protein K8H74_15535 [Notoacmeibacter sp.]|nr:hypothetical protein [Notoacmeibacter sp.]
MTAASLASAPVQRADLDESGPLAAIIGQLASPRAEIERTFLDMGARLVDCIALLNETSAAYERMPVEMEGPDIDRASQLLATIRGKVEEMADASSYEQATIERLAPLAARVATSLADLRSATRAVRFIAVNARIAAAYVQAQQEDMAAFTKDMMGLSRQVEEVVAAFIKAYEEFAANLAGARSASAAFAARHGSTMAEISGRLIHHLTITEEHRNHARAGAAEHGQVTDKIRSRIGAAVGALQIGDITRQRVEHIEQALQFLVDWERNQLPETDRSHDHTRSAVCHLQSAQLDETLKEFDQQIVDLAQSLQTLAADANAVLRAGHREAEALLSAGGTALNALIDDLGEIGLLFADFGKTRARMELALNGLAHSASVMVKHLGAIDAIEREIRMLSLNTTIHCGRLGEDGSGLRTIAHDLRELAQRTVTATGAIKIALDVADGLAKDMSDSRSLDLGSRTATLENDARTASDLFGTVVSRLRDHAGIIATVGPRAVDQLEAAVEAVSGRRDFVEDWRDACVEIVSLTCLDQDGLQTCQIDADILSNIFALYTMDSERQVHGRLFGTFPSAMAATDSPSHVQEAIEDFFF